MNGGTVRKLAPEVAVQLLDGSTVTGRMRTRTKRTVNLIDSTWIRGSNGNGRVPLEGEVMIERDQVLWVQVRD